MTFEFTCSKCNDIHRGMPVFHLPKPASYEDIPPAERDARCTFDTDECVIDGKWFFVYGCLEIPVPGESERLIWGVWVSLSQASFERWRASYKQTKRAHIGPLFGWLNARLPYPNTFNLKTHLHLRDDGQDPLIELEPTDHPLAVEQRNGITVERVAEIYALMMHGREPSS